MDSLRDFIVKFKEFLLGDGNFLNLDEGLAPAIYIIILGILGIFVSFLIAIIVKNSGKAKKFKKQLDDATAYAEATGTIDEENVAGLNQKIQQMPESVSRGWGNFLEQQTGYPSDYITKGEVFENKNGNPNYLSGWGVLNFFAILTILLCWAVSALGHADILLDYPAHLEKTAVVLGYILPVFGALLLPLFAYLIFYFIFAGCQKKTLKKLESSFSAFQDALDNNVIIFREANDEFIEENIEEINAAIEDILANKLGQNDILEIVTTPEIDEDLIIEETQEVPLVDEEPWVEEEPIKDEDWLSEPAEETTEEEAVEEVKEETAEERERRLGERLVQLVFLADQASKDPNITAEEMSELRAFLAATKDSGDYPSDAEQEIFESCLIILDGAYEVRFASEPEKVEEPVEESAAEVVEEPTETEEERLERERGERLVQLVFLADQASRDKEISEKDFVELRNFLAATKDSGDYPSEVEQEIFESCLQILDNSYEAKFGKPSPFVAQQEEVEEQVAEEVEEPVVEETPEQEAVEEPAETEEKEEEPVAEAEEEQAVEEAEESVEEPVAEEVEESAVEETPEQEASEEVESVEEPAVEETSEQEVSEEVEPVEEPVEEGKSKKKGLFGRRKKK